MSQNEDYTEDYAMNDEQEVQFGVSCQPEDDDYENTASQCEGEEQQQSAAAYIDPMSDYYMGDSISKGVRIDYNNVYMKANMNAPTRFGFNYDRSSIDDYIRMYNRGSQKGYIFSESDSRMVEGELESIETRGINSHWTRTQISEGTQSSDEPPRGLRLPMAINKFKEALEFLARIDESKDLRVSINLAEPNERYIVECFFIDKQVPSSTVSE